MEMHKKWFKLSVIAVILAWIICSVGFSIGATFNEDFTTEGGMIENRLGLVVVEVARIHENELGETCDRWGYYIDGKPGDIAVMVWNPFTRYFDDIIARWDF